MAINSLQVLLNRTHFVRYEPARSVVRVTIAVTPAAAHPGGETVDVTLRRRNVGAPGERVLASVPIPVPAGSVPSLAATFDLAALVTADGYPAALLSREVGDYRVAVAVGGVILASAPLTVALVSVEELRTRWLLGLPLTTAERLGLRTQPRNITGAAIVDVSQDTPLGAATLAYATAGQTLTWAGGPAVSIGAIGIGRYVLQGGVAGYLVVEVDPTALPGGNASDLLTVDYAVMTDDALLADVIQTADDIERGIQVYLEPRRVVSSRLIDPALNASVPADVDAVVDGVAWYRPHDESRWISIKLPIHSVLKVLRLDAWFNQTRVGLIPPEWIVVTTKIGLIEIVPATLAAINWVFYGVGFYTMFSRQENVPQFWQFELIAGLREMPPGLVQFIAKRAAMAILLKAGQARYPAGAAGSSLSRDGVSESTSITPGVFMAQIQQYAAETGLLPNGKDSGVTKWRDRLAGVRMITL